MPTLVTWTGMGATPDWGDVNNWSSHARPGPSDDVVIDARARANHSSGADRVQSLSVGSSSSLDLSGGSLAFGTTFTLDGSLLIDGGSLDLLNKTVDGAGTISNARGSTLPLPHVTLHPSLLNQGEIVARSGVDLTGTYTASAGSILRVIGDDTGTVAFQHIRFATGFTNHGLIETSTDAPNHYVTIGFRAGTLTNASDGTIHSLASGGGAAAITTDLTNSGTVLDNQGTVAVDDPLGLDLAAHQTALNGGTLTVSGADFGFGGAHSDPTTTFINTGGIAIASGHAFHAGTNGLQFNNRGGTVTGSGTFNLGGTVTTFDGDFNTNCLNLLISFATYNSRGTLTISPGSTLTVLYFSNTINAPVVNDGAISLSSIVGSNGCVLTVNGGLTNAGDGTILSDVGTGGYRTLNANTTNFGAIVVNLDLTINTGSSLATAGSILVTAGTLSTAGIDNYGSVEVDYPGALSVSNVYIQYDGSTYLNGGTLSAGGLVVDLEGGWLAGTGIIRAAVYNNAGVEVGTPGSPNYLVIEGDYYQTANAWLYLEIGGPAVGAGYGQLEVGGAAYLDGNLTVALIGGYSPPSGTRFSILTTSAGVVGTFATEGGDAGLFTTNYGAGVTLVA